MKDGPRRVAVIKGTEELCIDLGPSGPGRDSACLLRSSGLIQRGSTYMGVVSFDLPAGAGCVLALVFHVYRSVMDFAALVARSSVSSYRYQLLVML
jgi:hypothetical protein